MNLRLPLEIRSDSELNLDDTSSDRLDVCLKFETRELVHKFVDNLAHFRKLDDFSDLLSTHVIEVLPCELFLFLNFPKYLLGNSMILPQRGHRAPLSALHHFARVEESLAELGPLPLYRYFKKTPEYSAG